MKVKKSFQPLVDLLNENRDKLVSDVMAQVIALAAAKGGGGETSTVKHKGEVVAIRCYYYKRWMPLVGPEAVEFAVKESSNTGYNSMCKQGLILWTRENNAYKKGIKELFSQMESENLSLDDIKQRKAELEQIKSQNPENPGYGFETQEELKAYLDQHLA